MGYRQAFQNLSDGTIELISIPPPNLKSHQVLIRNEFSVISPGTERALIEFGKASLIQKARTQPEKVQEVRRKVSTDGLIQTMKAVSARLDEPLPLGYSSSGCVVAVGSGVTGLAVGDRVVSNAPHAELAAVSQNFVVKVRSDVAMEEASFAVLGAVAMEAVRLSEPGIGETVVVIGAGVIGLLACQLLQIAGCHVIVIDTSASRVEHAKSFGVEALLSGGEAVLEHEIMLLTEGIGADAVLIATSSSDDSIMELATSISRKRGRIVLVGTAGLKLSRSDFYEKELTFRVSSSYGPGRNDPNYENSSVDFPIAYVRWTAQRNIGSILALIRTKRLDVASLISYRARFEGIGAAYNELFQNKNFLTALITYSDDNEGKESLTAVSRQQPTLSSAVSSYTRPGIPRVSLIGAGNYARATLLPLLARRNVTLGVVVSQSGFSSARAQRRFGFERVSSDYREALDESSTDVAFITTRHDTHARYAIDALKNGLDVFVEKPLALNMSELRAVQEAYVEAKKKKPGLVLAVGFNRRFAPDVQRVRRLVRDIRSPKFVSIRVMAGSLPDDHWVLNPGVGGGRFLAEGVHFVDLARYLIGCRISKWSRVGAKSGEDGSLVVALTFEDGSVASIEYVTSGSRRIPKERVELSVSGKTLWIDNFRAVRGFDWPGAGRITFLGQDKGHAGLLDAFLQSVTNGAPEPIPVDEIFEVAQVVIDIAQDGISAPAG
jgi:predicted dehydrogenase